MSDYTMLDTYGEHDYDKCTAYRFSVDVSDLAVGKSKDIDIPILRILDEEKEPLEEPVEAFTYKVKITME